MSKKNAHIMIMIFSHSQTKGYFSLEIAIVIKIRHIFFQNIFHGFKSYIKFSLL